MRTKEQIDLDIEDGIQDYTHEEWLLYNDLPSEVTE